MAYRAGVSIFTVLYGCSLKRDRNVWDLPISKFPKVPLPIRHPSRCRIHKDIIAWPYGSTDVRIFSQRSCDRGGFMNGLLGVG